MASLPPIKECEVSSWSSSVWVPEMCLPTENARKSSLKDCLVHNHILGEDEGKENGWSEEILKNSKHIIKVFENEVDTLASI